MLFWYFTWRRLINPLNAGLNPIRRLLALVGARHTVHVSRIRVNLLKTKQLIMYKAKIAVRSQIRTKHSTQGEHRVEFLNFKRGGT